jgi:signal transduction histidine kinase
MVSARRVPGSEFRVPRVKASTEGPQPGTWNLKPETPKSPDFVEISVADTGIGIGPDDLQRLFQEFEQLEPSYTKRYQGSGLGLALCKRLVELHGGRIWASSEGEGRGSTFTFTIPAAGPADRPRDA